MQCHIGEMILIDTTKCSLKTRPLQFHPSFFVPFQKGWGQGPCSWHGQKPPLAAKRFFSILQRYTTFVPTSTEYVFQTNPVFVHFQEWKSNICLFHGISIISIMCKEFNRCDCSQIQYEDVTRINMTVTMQPRVPNFGMWLTNHTCTARHSYWYFCMIS